VRTALAFFLFAVACSPAPEPTPPVAPARSHAPAASAPPPATPNSDAAFGSLAQRFMTEWLRRSPVAATAAGNHDYDGQWPDTSAEGETDELAFIARTHAELNAMPASALSAQNRIDAAILENQLDYQEFKIKELHVAETLPLYWTGLLGDGFDPLVMREFAPLADRMRSAGARLDGVPAVLANAKKRLKRPAKIQTETAIKQTKGLLALCKKQLPAEFAKLPDRARLEASAKAAAAALEDFLAFLEKDLLPRSDGSFRVGPAAFAKILAFELEDGTKPEDIVKGARELIDTTQIEMVETARELWPTLFKKQPFPPTDTKEQRRAVIKKTLDALAEDRPTNATIVKEARDLVQDATKFVREKNLVSVPDEECKVVEMPEYRRGVTIAYCDSTGPLEKKQESVYTISPTPSDWSAKRAESFYREYNRSMLHDLTVHEAMPGHFLQAMHANRTKDDLRAVFASGPFVEGWAVYGEWLMAKYGYGGPRVRMQRQKMALRVAANALLDHGVHAKAMEEKDALAMMSGDAFQEEGEAVAKWTRARLSAGQLTTYYYGFSQLLALRLAHEKNNATFDERAFHDRLLSFGSPAIRHVRALMQAR
jgi:uncharacterized protein (DUF885 family)